jgi:hypothetical protein
MALMETQSKQLARSGPGYAYLMTGIALGSICVSGILGGIFTPDMVTGSQHQHFPGASVGWIFDLIAIGFVVPAAMKGIRAKVTDPAPWTMLSLGVSAVWLAVMFVAIVAPVWVTGTDPDQIPIWAGLGTIAGVIVTGILCNFVKTASFEPAAAMPEIPTETSIVGPEAVTDDATAKVRRLAQLRDSGAITEAEFQAKKTDLLNRI